MGKFMALINLFRVGGVVADPAKWKRRQITVTVLAPAVVALFAVLRAYGFSVPFSDDDAASIAGAVVVLANVVLTLATSSKVGLGRVSAADDGARMDGASAAASAAESADAAVGVGSDPSALQHRNESDVQRGNVAGSGGVNPFRDDTGA